MLMTLPRITESCFLSCQIIISECSSVVLLVLEKTIVLLDMIFRLLYFDKIYLYAKNLEQSKYQLLQKKGHLNQSVKRRDMNQKPRVDYFIRGRHKNCSVVYLLQG